jgi:hypothetical protein
VREKLNENPIAQVALVAILVGAAGFMLLSKSGGGESETEAGATEASVAVAGTGVTGTATGTTPGEAVEGAVEDALGSVSAETSSAVVGSMPVPPLPAPVAGAYDAGKTVVLLVVDDDGVEGRAVARAVQTLRGVAAVDLTIVPARRIFRYAALTLGTEVQQVPALIVMRPRRLSGATPQASVSYGFQTPETVVQAVRDASYRGPEATYHPD